jgi:hypothetical protein
LDALRVHCTNLELIPVTGGSMDQFTGTIGRIETLLEDTQDDGENDIMRLAAQAMIDTLTEKLDSGDD